MTVSQQDKQMEAQSLSHSSFQPGGTQNAVQEVSNIKHSPSFGVARWNVERNDIIYQKEDSHTLSIYLKGGETSYRADKKSLKGAPGKFCLMPQGHESQWHINGEIEFLHLYFTDEMLKQYATCNFASDIRYIELRDLIYQDDKILKDFFWRHFSLSDDSLFNSPLLAEEIIHKVMHHLLQHYNGFDIQNRIIRGGLSNQHMQLVRTRIHDQIADKHTLEMLAAEVNLSPFHFARMFKESFGETPALYVTRQRITAVKNYLKTKWPLSEVSLRTGFSHQSHMTKNFRIFTGMTPSAYRQLL